MLASVFIRFGLYCGALKNKVYLFSIEAQIYIKKVHIPSIRRIPWSTRYRRFCICRKCREGLCFYHIVILTLLQFSIEAMIMHFLTNILVYKSFWNIRIYSSNGESGKRHVYNTQGREWT